MKNFDNILSEIEKRKLSPVPRYLFLIKRYTFLFLTIFSVFIVGTAISVTAFLFFDGYSLAEFFTSSSMIDDLVENISFLWVGVILLFLFIVYFNFKHTTRGYKYNFTKILLASILVGIIFGIILHFLSFGEYVHNFLLDNTDVYDNLF